MTKMRLVLLLTLVLVGCESPDTAVINSRDCHRLLMLAQTASDTVLVSKIDRIRGGAFPCYIYIDALKETK
jgi:hypothetical protein